MEKTKYEKYKGKYSDCKVLDFCLDMKRLKEGIISISHKGVKFATMTREEYDKFDSWKPEDKLMYLDGYWNYYKSMMA